MVLAFGTEEPGGDADEGDDDDGDDEGPAGDGRLAGAMVR